MPTQRGRPRPGRSPRSCATASRRTSTSNTSGIPIPSIPTTRPAPDRVFARPVPVPLPAHSHHRTRNLRGPQGRRHGGRVGGQAGGPLRRVTQSGGAQGHDRAGRQPDRQRRKGEVPVAARRRRRQDRSQFAPSRRGHFTVTSRRRRDSLNWPREDGLMWLHLCGGGVSL